MHRNVIKKAAASFVAAAMAVNGAAVSASTIFAADTVYEFEDATLTGTIMVDDFDGASGGKVAYMKDDGSISLDIEVASAGMYSLVFYVQGEGGAKQQNLSINGVSQGVLAIPESTTVEPVSLTVKLPAGKSTVEISKSWGWSRFDKLEVKAAELSEIKATHTNLCDINATDESRSLFDYLNSVYGNNILSGQQEIYQYGPHDFEYEFEYLNDTTGHYPAIRGFDFLNCANILYGSEDGTTDRMIDWAKNKNGIVTASWHITVPKKMEGYKVGDTNIDWNGATYDPKETDFVTSNVLKEGTVEREYYLTALEALAGQIKKLQDAGVPLIFRPLHEAEGGGGETGSWFWWGKDGSAVYKEIWKLTYDTLVNEYGLHNIIWEWNSYNFPTSKNWYPGDEYVDIIGYDKYNCTKYLAENNWQASYEHDDSAISPTFYGIMEMYDSKKMVAMAENDCFSTVENLTSEKAGWLYFCTWYDGGSSTNNFLTDPLFNTKEDTIEMYQSDYCITLDELPEDLYTKNVAPIDPALTTTVVTTAAPPTTTRATTAADPGKNYGKVVYEELNGTYQITLPKPSDEFYIVVDLPKDINYANGGLGVTIPLDGEYYWANIKWEASASGAVKVNVKDDLFNITLGTEEVTDEALLEKLKAELGKSTTYQGQIWYAQSGEEEASKDGIAIVDAYIMDESTTTPVTTVPVAPGTVVYGDANCDGTVDIADATRILQAIGNADKYSLDPEQAANADCYNPGSGITPLDALAVQKLDAKIIDSLPEIVED